MTRPADFSVLDTSPIAAMALDHDLRFVYANAAYLKETRLGARTVIGRHMFDVFPDSDERMRTVEQKFRAALAGEVTYLEDQLYLIADSAGAVTTRCWRTVQFPYGADRSGAPTHMVQFATDVTEEVMQRNRAQAISKELDHRVKNTFAVIMAIIDLTGDEDGSVEAFRSGLRERLFAMGRTHTLLSESHWAGCDLRTLLLSELAPYANDQIRLDGPFTPLNAKSTQDASMLIHEFATNAAKYGCFSVPDGRLSVEWRIESDSGDLVVDWRESGLSGLSPPSRTGFGFQLPHLLPHISLQCDFRPEGLALRLRVPFHLAIGSAAEGAKTPQDG